MLFLIQKILKFETKFIILLVVLLLLSFIITKSVFDKRIKGTTIKPASNNDRTIALDMDKKAKKNR